MDDKWVSKRSRKDPGTDDTINWMNIGAYMNINELPNKYIKIMWGLTFNKTEHKLHIDRPYIVITKACEMNAGSTFRIA